MGAALGSQYGAMTVAEEILIAQLHSQSKLTTARHENRKIQYKNKLLKAKEPTPDVWKCQIYRMTPKKHTTKSRETIPLSAYIKDLTYPTSGIFFVKKRFVIELVS
jgi:hypothetical protein